MHTICSQIIQDFAAYYPIHFCYSKNENKNKACKTRLRNFSFKVEGIVTSWKNNLKVNPEMPVADKPKANMFWGIVLKADKR